MTSMNGATLEIEVDAMGQGRVLLNGVDIASVLQGVSIHMKAGAIVECQLRVIPSYVRIAPVAVEVSALLATLIPDDRGQVDVTPLNAHRRVFADAEGLGAPAR